jgi:two-component system, sensor histidine kinase and response regulator
MSDSRICITDIILPVISIIEISAIQKNYEYQFGIRDTGIGIDQDKIDKIFHSELDLTTLALMHEMGPRLRLLLCKDFIKLDRGKIWLESEKNRGTVFYFSIPSNVKEVRELEASVC